MLIHSQGEGGGMIRRAIIISFLCTIPLASYSACTNSITFYHNVGWYGTYTNFSSDPGHLLIYDWGNPSIGQWDTARDPSCQGFDSVILPWLSDCYVSANWNNPTCSTLNACPSTATPMVLVAYNQVDDGFVTHSTRWIVDSVDYEGISFNFDDSSAAGGATNYELPPIIIGVTCPPRTIFSPTDSVIPLAVPILSGYFGDGSTGALSNPIAGVVIVYQQSGCYSPPTSGVGADWTVPADMNAYVNWTNLGSAIYLTVPEEPGIWFSYRPILQYDGACAAGPQNCTQAELQVLDAAGFSLAYTARNSDGPYNCCPTPVEFTSFTAVYRDLRTVDLTWETAFEADAMGFYLYRSLNGQDWSQVNIQLIPAQGIGGAGASYSFTDIIPKQRTFQLWQYKVEEITVNGQRASEAYTMVRR